VTRDEYYTRKANGQCCWPGCMSDCNGTTIFCDPHAERKRAHCKKASQKPRRRKLATASVLRLRKKRRKRGLCVMCEAPSRRWVCPKCIHKERKWSGRGEVKAGSWCSTCSKRGHRWEECQETITPDIRIDDFATARKEWA
jgi:hypothetical protein